MNPLIALAAKEGLSWPEVIVLLALLALCGFTTWCVSKWDD